MNYDHFLGKVQAKARLASEGDALDAVKATLRTLGKRLPTEEADNLASELPHQFKEYLLHDGEVEKLSLDEFFERVSVESKKDLPDAIHHARAVVDTVREAVSEGRFDKLEEHLPEDFRPLLRSGSDGPLRR